MVTHLRVLGESSLMYIDMTGLTYFSKIYLRRCALDESSLIIGRGINILFKYLNLLVNTTDANPKKTIVNMNN